MIKSMSLLEFSSFLKNKAISKVLIIPARIEKNSFAFVNSSLNLYLDQIKKESEIEIKYLVYSSSIKKEGSFFFRGRNFFLQDQSLEKFDSILLTSHYTEEFYLFLLLLDEIISDSRKKKIKLFVGGAFLPFLKFRRIDHELIRILNKFEEVRICPFKIRDLYASKELSYSFEFEKTLSNFKEFDQYFCSIEYLIDYCYKKNKYGKCLFCEFHQSDERFFLLKRPKMSYSVSEFRRFDQARRLILLNHMSGPAFSVAVRYFETFKDLVHRNVELYSMFVFSRDFEKTLREKASFLNSKESENFRFNHGVETLSDRVRRLINKDYIDSKTLLKKLIFLLKETNVKLSLNFICLIKPYLREEFEEEIKNLLLFAEAIDQLGFKDRIEFIINPVAEYFNLESIRKIQSFDQKDYEYFSEDSNSSYFFYPSLYNRKLYEFFLNLKKKNFLVTISESKIFNQIRN